MGRGEKQILSFHQGKKNSLEINYLIILVFGNLISGSSAFSKSSLNIWKFTVHILLKPGLENEGKKKLFSIRHHVKKLLLWNPF